MITTGLINSQRMPQNHPCVIDIIRRRYLYPVVDDEVDYKLKHPEVVDPSKGQAARWRQYFGNQVSPLQPPLSHFPN